MNWTSLSGSGLAGSSFIRLRMCSDISDISSPSTYARDGEVEDYTINISPSLLPVVLTEFNVAANNNTALITWTTASEYNCNFFEIQRSSDLTNWISISQITGQGFSNQAHVYNFTDLNPMVENYYRLKQVDFDGRFNYTPFKRVTFKILQSENIENIITLYPNPATAEINIQSVVEFEKLDINNITVYSLTGNIIYSSEARGKYHRIQLESFMPGVYIINAGISNYKFIKQ